METFTLRFGLKKDKPLPYKEAVNLAKNIRKFLTPYEFKDKKELRFFFDVAQISVENHPEPTYSNPEEIFSFGIRNALEILLLDETSVLPSIAKEGKYREGEYGCGFRFFMESKTSEASIAVATYGMEKREPNPNSWTYFGFKTRDNAFGEHIFNMHKNIQKNPLLTKNSDCQVVEEWIGGHTGHNWCASMFSNNSLEMKLKGGKPKLSLDNVFLLEHFKPFFEALDKEAKEQVIDRLYDYLNNKDAIIKYLETKYPEIISSVGRDRLVKSMEKDEKKNKRIRIF